jgi:hypothetical protein
VITREPTVVAIIAAYNEADIIGACLRHLHAQRIETYLIDDGSTDDTARIAESFAGAGLRGLERLPPLTPARFSLERILERKEALSAELEADWFINHDADEFRESLWNGDDLRGAIARVDALGWNALDFQIFTIPPTCDGEGPTAASPDATARWYVPGGAYDRAQVRAWKRQPRVDLRSSAGHDVQFDGRRVFPLRFPMRHYPVRSQAHGERKLFVEREPRYDPAERSRGWHVQYGSQSPGSLLPEPADLRPYDLATARILSSLANRDVESAQSRIDDLSRVIDALDAQVQARIEAVDALQVALSSARSAAASQERALLDGLEHQRRELEAVLASKTWRWTAPVRSVLSRFGWA